MVRARPAGTILTLALAACAAPAYTAIEQGTAEVRVVVTRAGTTKNAVALAGNQPFRADLDAIFERGDQLEVWVFGYGLAQLAATYPALAGKTAEEAAAMLLPAPGARDGHDPPEAQHVLHATLAKDITTSVSYTQWTWAEWEQTLLEGNALPFSVEPTDVPPAGNCGTFAEPRVQPITIPGARMNARWAVPLSGGAVFVGTSDFKYFRIAPDKTVTQLETPRDAQAGAADSSDGETVWMADAGLARAKVRETIMEHTYFARSATAAYITRMAVLGDEVYTLAGDGSLELFDARTRRWRTLHRFPPANTYSGLVVLGPGHVAAASASSNMVVRIKDGMKYEEAIPGASSTVGALGYVRDFGLVAGTTVDRLLFVHDGTSWSQLPDSHTDVLPCVIAPFAGGIFVGGQYGQSAIYMRDRGVCYHQPIAPGTLHWSAPFGDGLLVTGDASNAGLQAEIVTPR